MKQPQVLRILTMLKGLNITYEERLALLEGVELRYRPERSEEDDVHDRYINKYRTKEKKNGNTD